MKTIIHINKNIIQKNLKSLQISESGGNRDGCTEAERPYPFYGSIQNNSWFKFIASDTDIELEFTTTNCPPTGDPFFPAGIQVAILAFVNA